VECEKKLSQPEPLSTDPRTLKLQLAQQRVWLLCFICSLSSVQLRVFSFACKRCCAIIFWICVYFLLIDSICNSVFSLVIYLNFYIGYSWYCSLNNLCSNEQICPFSYSQYFSRKCTLATSRAVSWWVTLSVHCAPY